MQLLLFQTINMDIPLPRPKNPKLEKFLNEVGDTNRRNEYADLIEKTAVEERRRGMVKQAMRQSGL